MASAAHDSAEGQDPQLTDEVRYRLLGLVAQNPTISQREAAQALGISLGKTNYCLQALARRGLLKISNFKNSKNKIAYMYLLTPRGITDKAEVTARFLHRKMQEYEVLREEIERLREETERQGTT